MLEAFQILTNELPLVTSNISALIVVAVVFAISYKLSSLFENGVFRYLIIVLAFVILSNPIHPQYHSVFFNAYNWIALGGLAPHLRFLIEDIEEKYYQLKYATINAYYFWLTIYFKVLKILKYIIWLLITIFYLLAWILFGIINFAELTRLVALAIWEKIASKENAKFKDELYSYWSWFKQNHEEQKQRRYWNENSEWYEGRKFYFRDAEPQKQNHKQESNKQENKQQDYEKAYDKYKQKHGYTGQEESKSYQKSYQNNQSNKQQQSHGSEYDRFFSGDYYAILGVGKDASMKEITEAWRSLLKIYHPDLHPEDVQTYTKIAQKLNEAHAYFKKHKGSK